MTFPFKDDVHGVLPDESNKHHARCPPTHLTMGSLLRVSQDNVLFLEGSASAGDRK